MCKVHPGEGLRDKVLQKAFGRFRAQREERGVCDPKSCVLSFARHGSYSTLTLQCIADVFVHGRLGGGAGGYICFTYSSRFLLTYWVQHLDLGAPLILLVGVKLHFIFLRAYQLQDTSFVEMLTSLDFLNSCICKLASSSCFMRS